ncbi:MAG: hypothetical protein WAM58_16710 [Candidatus Acidiferrum sp.]
MLQFGILTSEQYARATMKRRMAGSGVAFTLLETSDPPTQDEVQRFEEISYSLRTSNGTTRMTFRNRMPDVNEVALKLIRGSYRPYAELIVQDRAASTCLTSTEWARQLLSAYPKTQFEASDALLHLLRISVAGGQTFIVEPGGQPLQYIASPFAVCLCPREPLRYLLNHLVLVRARKMFRSLALPKNLSVSQGNKEYRIGEISCVHPEAGVLSKNDPRFTIRTRSVFDRSPGVDVVRTMNILNLAYFPTEQLIDGIQAAFQSVKPGGLWIVGRTHEEDSKNHVTFFRRTDKGWQVLERIGNGSEIEMLVTADGNGQRNDNR